jgi:hypothetical protein
MRMLAVKNTIYLDDGLKRNSRSTYCEYVCWIYGGGVQSGVGLVGIKHDLRNLRRDKLEGCNSPTTSIPSILKGTLADT